MFHIFIAILFSIYSHVRLLYGLICSILPVLSIIDICYSHEPIEKYLLPLDLNMSKPMIDMMKLGLRLGL